MADSVVVIGSFLLAFKAILIEGSEVAILSVATISQLGRRNVLFGVVVGAGGSLLVFLLVRTFFLLLPDILIDLATGSMILYFSYRFLRGFKRYYFGKRSFVEKMRKMEDEVVKKDMERYRGSPPTQLPFSPVNSLPVMTITLTEGFEASLVLAAAGAFNFQWTIMGALSSIILLIVTSAISNQYLLRVPRWGLDLLAGSVLLIFGSFFLISGILAL